MSFMDQIGGLLNQYAGGAGATSREEARAHYDQIAGAVPSSVLGSIIGPALSSLGTDQVKERIYNSATEMSPEQRGGFLQSILGGLSSSGLDIGSILGQLGVNRNIANNPEEATPDEVAAIAAHAQQTNPSIFEKAMSFYAEHPTLVKILGTMAVAAIAKRLHGAGAGQSSLGGLFGG